VGYHAATGPGRAARTAALPGPRPAGSPPGRPRTAVRPGPAAVGLAVRLGESIGQVRRESAAPAASPGSVTAPWVIRPPAAAGFVRWRDAIGYNSMGAPVVACHWGPWGAPAAGGTWLAWWADSHAMTAAYEAAARADGQHASFGALTEAFGPLWYDHQELLRPGTAPGGSAVPEPQATAAALSPPEDGTSGLALLRTTLATWHLMTCPEAVQLSRRPLPAAEQAADRAAGLAVGPVTCATPTGKR
jgi:hypothetical protein